MKLIAAFFLLALYTVNGLPMGDSTGSTHTHTSNHKSEHSAIRKTANDLAPPERRFASGGDTCVGSCAQEMKEKTARDEQTSSDGESWKEKYTKKCRIHDTTKTCLNRCQSSETKAKMTNQMSLMQYVCHDSTYLQNVNCINEVSALTANERQRKCAEYQQKIQHYNRNQPTSQDQFKDMIKNTCLDFKCDLDTDKAKVIEKCGQAAFNDYRGMYAKSAEVVKNTVERAGLGSVYPRECDRISAA